MSYRIYRTFLSIFVISLSGLLFSANFASAKEKPIFEGYYKVTAGQKHIGFVVHRYSFSEEKKQFRSTYYIKTNKLGGEVTESLNAVANDKFEPISYQFTQTMGSTAKLIDAKFTGTAMQATISDGQKAKNVTKSFPKGSFLSTFLGYLMLQRGLITDKHYQYHGIAEEDAQVYKGSAYIKKDMDTHMGMKMFKVLNIFKDTKFSSLVNEKGEAFGTRSPAQKIATELVSKPIEATAGIQVNTAHLVKLFGNVPTGDIHSFFALKTGQPSGKLKQQMPLKGNQGKKGFPQGQGAQLKGQPPIKNNPVQIGQPGQQDPKGQ